MLAHNRSTVSPTLVVHETARPPAPILRYIDQVTGAAGIGVDFRYSQGVLTRFDVDVVHVAEPNLDMLLGTRGATDFQRLAATMALTRNLRRHGIALVRTLSGVDEAPTAQHVRGLAARMLDSATDAFIVLDEATPTPDPERTTVIPHAHFRDRFIGYPRGELVPGRMLCAATGGLPDAARGLLGIPQLVETAGVTVRIAGTATAALEAATRSAMARDLSTISARFERLSDSAQIQEIDAAELVVIPRMQSFEDLQTVFLALSLDRPVLVPHSETLARLSEAVGSGWVHVSPGPITAESVDGAFASTRRSERSDRPRLGGRELETTHAAHAGVFRAAATAKQRRRRAHTLGRRAL